MYYKMKENKMFPLCLSLLREISHFGAMSSYYIVVIVIVVLELTFIRHLLCARHSKGCILRQPHAAGISLSPCYR